MPSAPKEKFDYFIFSKHKEVLVLSHCYLKQLCPDPLFLGCMWIYFRVLVLDAKILVMSHNLPARLFPQWSYKVLNLPERYLNYETSHEEPVEATISECLTALLKLGKHLLRYPKV